MPYYEIPRWGEGRGGDGNGPDSHFTRFELAHDFHPSTQLPVSASIYLYVPEK